MGFWSDIFGGAIYKRVYELRKLHNEILFGRQQVADISEFDLLSLQKPLWTRVGMGGIGPQYNPSFDVFEMIAKEIRRRRNL